MSVTSGKKALEELRAILAAAKTIAIVGLSDKPDRPSYGVAAYLQAEGYRIIPINPTISEVLGEKSYPSLQAIPAPQRNSIDIVDIFRRAEYIPPIVEEAIAIGANVVWMQVGITHPAAAARAEAAGLTVVMDTCTAATHRHLRAMGKI